MRLDDGHSGQQAGPQGHSFLNPFGPPPRLTNLEGTPVIREKTGFLTAQPFQRERERTEPPQLLNDQGAPNRESEPAAFETNTRRSLNPGLFFCWSGIDYAEFGTTAFQAPGQGLHILPDTGAVGNVCGESWAQKAVQQCERLGLPYTATQLKTPRGHNGVGKGAVNCEWTLSVPVSIGKRGYTYTADVLPCPNVPALMGLRDMAALDVYYSVRHGTFILPGPGGLNLAASPGTEVVNMRRIDENHHWFLPVNTQLAKAWLSYSPEQRAKLYHKVGGKQILYPDPH